MAQQTDDKLTWKKLRDISDEQADELRPIYSYPDKDVAVPANWYEKDMSVVVMSADKKATILPLHESPDRLPPEFEWAKESFAELTKEWDKIASGEEKALSDNFRQRHGVLCLSEGPVDRNRLWNTINQTNLPETGTARGGYLPLSENKLNMDHFIIMSDKRHPTALLHELTHAADNPRGNLDHISQGQLFGNCLLLDRRRGSFLISTLDGVMQDLVAGGKYSKEQVKEEMLCRLNEKRHADPERFREECPLLDDFYGKVLYPALNAQTVARGSNEKVGSRTAHEQLHNRDLLKEQMKGLFPRAVFDEMFDRYLKIEKESNVDKKAELRRQQADFVDRLPGIKKMHEAMAAFQAEMKRLEKSTFSDHITEVPKVGQGRVAEGMVSRLRGASGQSPIDKHNAIDYRDVGGKDRKIEPLRITKDPQEELRQRKREELYQRMGLNKSILNKRGNSI